MRKLPEAQRLLTDPEFSTKVYLYFATLVAGEDFDPYESNYQHQVLNPITIKAYVSQVAPNTLVFKEIGLHETGAVQVITEEKHRGWFENASKIVIEDNEYQVFRFGTGSRSFVQSRPMKLVKIYLTRKE